MDYAYYCMCYFPMDGYVYENVPQKVIVYRVNGYFIYSRIRYWNSNNKMVFNIQ